LIFYYCVSKEEIGLENKPRKTWLAGALTVFSIGLGHLYRGRPFTFTGHGIRKRLVFVGTG
jgi:hypothetical protein